MPNQEPTKKIMFSLANFLFSGGADQRAANQFSRIIYEFAAGGSPYPGLPPVSPNSSQSQYLQFSDRLQVRPDYTATFWRYPAW